MSAIGILITIVIVGAILINKPKPPTEPTIIYIERPHEPEAPDMSGCVFVCLLAFGLLLLIALFPAL